MALVTMVFAVLGFLSPANRCALVLSRGRVSTCYDGQRHWSVSHCVLPPKRSHGMRTKCISLRNRGGLMTAMLLLFVFMGIFGGYAAGRLYKTFKVRVTRSPFAMRQAAP